jgi:hypothetical protein
MRIYLDNVIASGRIRGDLEPPEMAAVRQLDQQAANGKLEVLTARESWREQERTKDPAVRNALGQSRGDVPVVQDDHRVLGFSTLTAQYGGFIANPLVSDIVDETLFTELKKSGLKDADARHLMYAVCNQCDRFVTLDPDFIDRRDDLETLSRGLRIVKPSELVTELH